MYHTNLIMCCVFLRLGYVLFFFLHESYSKRTIDVPLRIPPQRQGQVVYTVGSLILILESVSYSQIEMKTLMLMSFNTVDKTPVHFIGFWKPFNSP